MESHWRDGAGGSPGLDGEWVPKFGSSGYEIAKTTRKRTADAHGVATFPPNLPVLPSPAT